MDLYKELCNKSDCGVKGCNWCRPGQRHYCKQCQVYSKHFARDCPSILLTYDQIDFLNECAQSLGTNDTDIAHMDGYRIDLYSPSMKIGIRQFPNGVGEKKYLQFKVINGYIDLPSAKFKDYC